MNSKVSAIASEFGWEVVWKGGRIIDYLTTSNKRKTENDDKQHVDSTSTNKCQYFGVKYEVNQTTELQESVFTVSFADKTEATTKTDLYSYGEIGK